MDSYQRIRNAVDHKRSDRLAIDYIATPESHAALKHHMGITDDEQLLRRLGCDIRRVSGQFVGPDDMTGAAGVGATGKDFLGIEWKPVKNQFATYNEIAYHPLSHVTTVKEVEEYNWPSVD